MKEPWYVSERAENIAILRLTDDLDNFVVRREEKGPYDLVLGLSREAKRAAWQIVVEVKGLRRTKGDNVRVKTTESLREFLQMDDPRPVALLAVDVESTALYFAWLRAPVLEPKPHLDVLLPKGDIVADHIKPSDLKKQMATARKYFAGSAR